MGLKKEGLISGGGVITGRKKKGSPCESDRVAFRKCLKEPPNFVVVIIVFSFACMP